MPNAYSVKQFLATADQHLCIGDIILSRSPTLASKLIRFATGSQFSHAALVFLVAKPEEGFNNTFLLESISSGVGLVNLRDYIGGKFPRAEVVILRLEGEGLNESYFKRVRGLMLDHVNSGYDFNRIMRLGLAAAFGMRLSWATIRKGPRRSMADAIARTRKRLHRWVPPQFICSGFIQYGLAKAAEQADIQTDVMLKEGLYTHDRDGILAVTPEEVARSKRLTWRFAVRKGRVHGVYAYDEAVEILNRR